MKLIDIDKDGLIRYIRKQLDTFYPDQRTDTRTLLALDIDESLDRLQHCINSVKLWQPDEFYYLHSEQYTIFLYYLANTIWHNRKHENICTKLFYLNKTLNGFNCFYDVELPSKFFIGHSVGIVLARTHYSDYMVLYQNSTVGKNHGAAPMLEEGVVMYPNTAIIGDCQIGKNSVICQGTSVINQSTPGNCYVFGGDGKDIILKDAKRNVLSDIFRL